MSQPEMFTPEEAFTFLEQRLGVNDPRGRVINDRKSLLDDVTTAMQVHIPFTNINLLKDPPEKRRRPTIAEVKDEMESGSGGLCYDLNLATFFLLKAIGYDVKLASAAVRLPRYHVIVYVSGVEKPGDCFLVEAGVGYPTNRAISLDFETDSPVFVDSFLEYKYIKREGQLWRMHGRGDLATVTPEMTWEGAWRRMYSAELTGSPNVEEFYGDFDQVFTDPLATSYHNTFRLIQFPDKRAVIVSGSKLIVENDKGEIETTQIEGGDPGILATIMKYFPTIKEESARLALKYWRAATEKA